jgi:tripartite-type tricarboxylate transporter receptor subunit TctC
MTESGLPQVGFNPDVWMGLFAPAGTPRPIVDRIAHASHQVMAEKDFQSRLVSSGLEPVLDSSPEHAAKYVKDDLVRWAPVVKAAGLALN